MDTIPYEMLYSWFEGRVKIRKMLPFEDSRGMLGEIYRKDSEVYGGIVNTYISETKPFIQRGPHEHEYQDDEFITWNSRMMYEFYDPKSGGSKYFITEPKGIYGIYVEHGVHHGYRNLDAIEVAYTLNSLNRLYKGYGRNEAPDEVRHEKKTINNKVLVILGASSGSGMKLLEESYKTIGEHLFDVIPYMDEIVNMEELMESLSYALKGRDVTIVGDAGSGAKLGCSLYGWKFVEHSVDESGVKLLLDSLELHRQ